MTDKMKYLTFTLIFLLAIAIPVGLVIRSATSPGQYDEFVACIEDSGAVFYGAFWCVHCQSQKAAFGKSAQSLPYVECSTPDGRGQNAACNELEIESYPTWIFADGTRATGLKSLEELSALTGCPIQPQTAS